MSDEFEVCGWSGCGKELSPGGPSPYFCSQDHQRQWYQEQTRARVVHGEVLPDGTHDRVVRERRMEEAAERALAYRRERGINYDEGAQVHRAMADGLWGLPFLSRMMGLRRPNRDDDESSAA